MFGSLVVDRTDINANTDAHRGGDGNLAEVLALRGSRLQLVELVDESHQVLLEAVSREGGTTDRGVDDTSLVGAELDLTGLGVLDSLGNVRGDSTDLRVRHQAARAEDLAELADNAHRIRGGDDSIGTNKGAPFKISGPVMVIRYWPVEGCWDTA